MITRKHVIFLTILYSIKNHTKLQNQRREDELWKVIITLRIKQPEEVS